MTPERNSENIKYKIPFIVHVFMSSLLVSFGPIAVLYSLLGQRTWNFLEIALCGLGLSNVFL